MWSSGISSSKVAGNIVVCFPRLTPDIRHKKMPPLPRGHLLIPYQGRLVFRNRLSWAAFEAASIPYCGFVGRRLAGCAGDFLGAALVSSAPFSMVITNGLGV